MSLEQLDRILQAVHNQILDGDSKFLQQNLNPVKGSMHLMMVLDTILE